MQNINLDQYLEAELPDSNSENLDLRDLITAISKATISIAKDTRITGLKKIRGSLNKINVQGEQVKILDELSNDKLLKAL